MRKQDLKAVDDFPDGFFFIRCKEKDMTIDVNNGGMLNDATMIIWPQKMVDSINQLWMHEEGFLINKKSGLVIDIRGGDIKKDKPLIQYARKPGLAHNQRWQYKDGFIFPQASPHLVIDIRGGDFKETNGLFLNTKNTSSKTQQWLIQPFENEKSKDELALLRPPPSNRTSCVARPEELCDFYRMVYIEKQQGLSNKEMTGAAAFKAIKDHIAHQKKIQQPIVTADARDIIQALARKEIQTLCRQEEIQDLIQATEQSALNYFVREYEE
ncbi:ricin B lectin domain-containing protein [Chlamydoabsidia padenii]|nr:ricin B lectin domain-containing protein [Chlamydoabsidia padenii]